MSALDFQAAKAKRERELEEARQQGMLEMRRYYLGAHEKSESHGGFWIGLTCGLLLAAFVGAVVRSL